MRFRLLFFLAAIFCLRITVAAQDQNAASENWQRYTDKGEEFSILLPELPGAFEDIDFRLSTNPLASQRLGRYYAAYGEGALFFVFSYQKSDRLRSLDDVAGLIKAWHWRDAIEGRQQKIQLNGAEVIQVVQEKEDLITVGHFYKTKNNFYYLRASGDKANLALLEKFLLSFTVSPKPEAQLIGVGGRLELPPIPYNSTATDMVNKSDDKTANDKTDFTRKALIYLRPSPPYTEGARRASVQGTVAIRCLLSSSGRVTSLELLKKLDPGLDKNALAAARKIYFLPAKKGGRLVSQWIQVEYEFHLF